MLYPAELRRQLAKI